MYNAPYQGVASQLSQYGRFGDSQLVHLNPAEVKMLASMSPTGQLTRNPMTGQPEAFLPFLAPLLGSFLGSSLLTGAGAGVLGAAGLSSAAAGAIGSGLATAAATGDLEQGIMSGITGFGLGQAFGAAGNAAAKAGTDVAATTQAATDAATTFSPAAAASTMNPLATDASLQSAIQSTPSSFSPGMAGAQMASAPNFAGISPIQPPAPTSAGMTATQRMAAPFQQPGAFMKQLASPGSYLPAYVGETSRMARQQEIAGQGSAAEFEQNQEKEKARIRGQMGDVFGSIRKAYPGVGYSQGGIVDRYFEGGDISQQIADALKTYNQNIPDAEDVQLSLRGQYARTPPAASYSALDVGGEGYVPGIAPEFKYFTDYNPNPPVTSTRPAREGDVGFEPGPVVPRTSLNDYLSGSGSGTPAGGAYTAPPQSIPSYSGDLNTFNLEDLLNSGSYSPSYNRPYVDPTAPVDQIIPYGGNYDVTGIEDLINRGGGNYNAAAPVETPVQQPSPEVAQPPSYPDFQDFLNSGNYGGYFPDYSQPAPVAPPAPPVAPTPQFDSNDISLANDMYYFNPADDVPAPAPAAPYMPPMEQPSLENDMYFFNPEDDVPAPAPVTPYTPPQSESDIQSEYEKLLESLNEYGGGGGSGGGRFDRADYQEFAEGGMTQMSGMPMGGQDDIVSMTVSAIRGEVENADQIIRVFVEQYGPEAFMQLREQVLQEIVPGAQTQGMVEGMGGGQDDKVMGMIGSQRPVAVSPGEYIIPADAVALAGGGYSGDGASFFDGLVDDIRRKTMGSTKQVKPYR